MRHFTFVPIPITCLVALLSSAIAAFNLELISFRRFEWFFTPNLHFDCNASISSTCRVIRNSASFNSVYHTDIITVSLHLWRWHQTKQTLILYCLCRSSSCANSSFNLLHSSFKSSSFGILFHFMKRARVNGLTNEYLVSFRNKAFIVSNWKSPFSLQSEFNKTVLRQKSVKYNLYIPTHREPLEYWAFVKWLHRYRSASTGEKR